MLAFPTYGFFAVFAWKPKRTIKKITLAILFAILALGSIPLIIFYTVDFVLTAKHSGLDPAFAKVRVLNLIPYRIAVYRTDGGAMTSFSIIVRSEKSLCPGIYIEHDLFDVDGASDVSLDAVDADSFRINSINFDSPDDRAYFLSHNPKATEDQIIKVN